MAISDEFKRQFKAGNFVDALKLALAEVTELKVTTWVVPATSEASRTAAQPAPGYRLLTRMNLVEGRIENEVGTAFLRDGSYADSDLWQFHMSQVESGQQSVHGNLQGLRELFATLSYESQNQLPVVDSRSHNPIVEVAEVEAQDSESQFFRQLDLDRHYQTQYQAAQESSRSNGSEPSPPVFSPQGWQRSDGASGFLATTPDRNAVQQDNGELPGVMPLVGLPQTELPSNVHLDLTPDVVISTPPTPTITLGVSDNSLETTDVYGLDSSLDDRQPSPSTMSDLGEQPLQLEPMVFSGEDIDDAPMGRSVVSPDAGYSYSDDLDILDTNALDTNAYDAAGVSGIYGLELPNTSPNARISGGTLPDASHANMDANIYDPSVYDPSVHDPSMLGLGIYDPNLYHTEPQPVGAAALPGTQTPTDRTTTTDLRLLLIGLLVKLMRRQLPTAQELASLKAAGAGLFTRVTHGRTPGESLAAGAAIVAVGTLLLWGADRAGISVPFLSANKDTSETIVVSPTPVTGFTAPVIPSFEFLDVPQDHWAYPFITAMAERKFVEGNPQGEFEPNKRITRAEFAALLGKPLNQPPRRNSVTYRDVLADHWAVKVIDEATRTAFMRGYPKQEFRPENPVTRTEVLVTLVSGLDLKPTIDPAKTLKIYKDHQKIPKWAVRAIAAATEAGLVVNYADRAVLNPQRPATRAEATAMMHQALVKLGKIDPVTSQYIVKYGK
jgi:hypothetical protein